jgi:transposase
MLKQLTRSYRKLKGQLTSNRMAMKSAELPQVRAAYIAVIASLQEALAELKKAIARHMRDVAPFLLQPTGFGPITGAVILAEIGSIARFPTRDHLASYSGSAPIPWSSGAHTSDRVNPGGNRHLNWALHMIVKTRLRIDPTTQTYRDRKLAQGKTKREIYRLLKTYVARETYRLMKANSPMT